MSAALRLKLKTVKVGVPVTAMPAFDPGKARKQFLAPIGATIEQIVAMALAPASEGVLRRTQVFLVTPAGQQEVDRVAWPKVKPLRTAHVVIRVLPGDPGTATAILSLAVKAAASSLGGSLATQLGLGALGKALLTTALSIAGGLLVNLLTKRDTDEEKPRYVITGWKNELSPNAPIPELFGRQRIAPRHASVPYIEIVDGDMYIRANFLWGFGPIELSELKIGDTKIEKFKGVTIEHLLGYATDPALTLYPTQVIEDAEGAELKRGDDDSDDDVAIERTLASDSTEACVIFAWPSGLYHIAKDGERDRQWTGLGLWQRLVGSETWEWVRGFWIDEREDQPFFRSHRWTLPTRGNYEIRIVRTSRNEDPGKNTDKCLLHAVQSFRPEYPFNYHKRPLALTSALVKASDQLNGTLDRINAIGEALKPDWTGTAWVERKTRNPASAALAFLRGPGVRRPAKDSQIDWPAFQAWHEFCVLKNLRYDRYHDFEGRFEETKNAIGAAGRAAIINDGLKWTVVIDRPRSMPVDHISPRNSSQFTWSATYIDPPQAVRVQFLDETNDYEQAERLIPWPPEARFATRAAMEANLAFVEGQRVEVYADATVSNNAYYEKVGPKGSGSWVLASFDVTEEWPLLGKTNPDEVWIEVRRLMWEKIFRFVSYSAVQDGIVRRATKGDLLMAARDVLVTAMHSGRIKRVVGENSGQIIVPDAIFKQEAGTNYAIRFRRYENDNDVIGQSIVRPVKFVAGECRSLTLLGTGPAPRPGDLIHFGPLASDSIPLVLAGVQRGSGNASILHMVPAAPEIDEKTDAEVPQTWSGRVGAPVSVINTAPAVPLVRWVRSGFAGTGTTNGLRIGLAPGQPSTVVVGEYQARYRKVGETVWQGPKAGASASGSIEITGYVAGDQIEMQPRALSIYNIASEWGATVTHTIGQDDAGQTMAVSASTVGTFNLGGVLFSLEGDPEDNNLRKVACHRRPVGVAWDPASVPFKTVELVGGAAKKVRDGAKRTSLYADPDFNTPGLHSVTGNFAVANGQATKTATTASSRLYQTLGAAPATGSAIRMAALVSATNDTDTFGFFLRNDVATAADAGTMSPSTGTGLRRGRISVTAARTLLGVTTSATRTITIEAMAGFVEQAGDLAAGDYIYRFLSLNGDDRAGAYSEITVSIV